LSGTDDHADVVQVDSNSFGGQTQTALEAVCDLAGLPGPSHRRKTSVDQLGVLADSVQAFVHEGAGV
jgi:hypothetical protein